MRIGINTLAINRIDFGGGERYIYFLIQHLARIDQENKYFIFVSPQNQDRFAINQENFQPIVCPVNINSKVKRGLYEQFFLPKLLKNYRLDVFHSPNNVLPFWVPSKSVLTIQSMLNFVMPSYYRPSYKRWYFNNLTQICARKATKIISVSNDNKYRIVKHLRIPENKVVVVYHGVDRNFRKIENIEEVKACENQLGIKDEYILCVANNYLYKNFGGLFRAFRYMKEKYKIPHKLVIAGNSGFSRERQLWLEKMKREFSEIIHLGYIDYQALPYLYNGADVFVLPSFCESFGIPIIEAMACGVPIVTSNIFAMPEVVGNAGLKVNPNNPTEIAEAVYLLLTNRDLRERLIKRGLERIRLFSWEKTAREMLKVYEEVYNS